MNQTPNDNVEQDYNKARGRADSNDLLISDIMELRQMEIETQEHDTDKKFVLNDPVIDELLVAQLYSIGSLKERLEVALDSLDAKLKSIEQNLPSYYGRGQYKKTESEKDKQRILNMIDVCANKLDQIEGKRGAKEIFYNPQSPQETLLMKILKIVETRPQYGNQQKKNDIERILMFGCDFTELYSDASSKVRILSIYMEQNDASMKAED